MKTNLRWVSLGLGLGGLVIGFGGEQRQTRAEEIPTYLEVAQAPDNSAPVPAVPPEVPAAPQPVAAPAEPPPAPAGAPPAQAVTPATLHPSPALAEVIRLLQAGVSEEVVLAYITNSSDVFNIGADEVLYLHDLGAPTMVLTTLIQRDAAPDTLARKQAANAVQPLPPGIAQTKPVPNAFAGPPPPVPAATNNPPAPMPVNPPAAMAASQPPPEAYVAPVVEEPADVSYFYGELAPYGTWVDVGGYGRCWRPTVAVWNSSWRPYGDCGRWLWSNCGWYWYSDYSWGWAPFHYGRWACPTGIGWVWTPDTCWGPAWVSWRYSSSYCGWAPLPPSACWVAGHGFYHNTVAVGFGFDFGLRASDFVFVSTGHFCDTRPSRYYLTAAHSATVFKETTVINNYTTVNKTVVNNGVGFERVANATRGNIRQVALKGTTEVRNTNTRRETLDPEGRTLTVVQPRRSTGTIPAPSAPVSAVSTYRPRTERVVASAPALASTAAANPAPSVSSSGNAQTQTRRPLPVRPSGVTPRSQSAPPGAAATGPPTAAGGRNTGVARTSPPNTAQSPADFRNSGGNNFTRGARPDVSGIPYRPQRSAEIRNAPIPTAPAPVAPNANLAPRPSAPAIPSSPRVESYRAPVSPPASHVSPRSEAPAARPAGPAAQPGK